MKRKLKFRYLWQSTWYYVDMYADNTALAYKEFESRNKTSHWLQFTGLLDKNGVEIYEGDIVKSYSVDDGENTDTIVFDNGCFILQNPFRLSWPLGDYKKHYIEVIGNIHQNPELL